MIKVGDKLPDTGFMIMGDNGPEPMGAADLFGGKKVVLFSVPGAFTPTCSAKHLPGFVENEAAIKAKGVDTIACVAVNDAFVMGAWGADQKVGDSVVMLADGSAAWSDEVGLGLDLVAAGLGKRGQRFAMIVDDGTVSHLAVEEGGAFEVSSADAIMAALG